MTNIMKDYVDLGKEILTEGEQTGDRTNVGTCSLFGEQLKFNVSKVAPLLSERKLPVRSIIGELLWFIEGSTNVDVLKNDYLCGFWDEWGSEKTRTIGPMYGKQWRDYNGVDQLAELLQQCIDHPTSRRLLVNTWIPDLIPDNNLPPAENPENGKMSLAPCHFAYQLKIYPRMSAGYNVLDLMFVLRSSDYLLGLPANIASYYFLMKLICGYLSRKTGNIYIPRNLVCMLGDVHIYSNHYSACEELFDRSPSASEPVFIVTDEMVDIFESYIDGSFEKSENKSELRKHNLRVIHKGVSNYFPGEPIKGARNV